MNNITPVEYGEYTTFISPYGYFDEFEFSNFVLEAKLNEADIAFCGNVRIFPDGSLSRAYHCDENLNLSGKEAFDMINEDRWIPPRFFGVLIKNKYIDINKIDTENEVNQIMQLVKNAGKVFIYGSYATYLDCKCDITSVHCSNPIWIADSPTKSAFKTPYLELPIRSDSRRAWILGTPEHANLGDQAIVHAMNQFVKETLPDIEVIEISESQLSEKTEDLVEVIGQNDLIFLVGGGNFGDLYPNPEKARRIAIENFKINPMILFPQSIYFQESNALKQTQKLLEGQSNLTLCAREYVSFEHMKSYFPDKKVLLAPDIVLSLKPELKDTNRKGALLLIRLDKESAISIEDLNKIRKLTSERFGEVILGDTIIRHKCMSREDELKKKLQQLRNAEIVITDRLHGAIFAAITQTPCVLLPNNYHKVEGVYEWMKPLPFIKLCKDITHFASIIEEVTAQSLTPVEYDLSSDFEVLKSLLRGDNSK